MPIVPATTPMQPLPPPTTACPRDLGETLLRELRDGNCIPGRRGRMECAEGIAAVVRIDPTCTTGHLVLRFVTTFTARTARSAEAARSIGSRGFVSSMRHSPDQAPTVQVVTAQGDVLCANIGGGPQCLASPGEILGR